MVKESQVSELIHVYINLALLLKSYQPVLGNLRVSFSLHLQLSFVSLYNYDKGFFSGWVMLCISVAGV